MYFFPTPETEKPIKLKIKGYPTAEISFTPKKLCFQHVKLGLTILEQLKIIMKCVRNLVPDPVTIFVRLRNDKIV